MNSIKNILYLGDEGKGHSADDILYKIFKNMFYENINRYQNKYEYNIDAYLPVQGYQYEINHYDLVVLGGGSLIANSYWLNLCTQAIDCNIPVMSWGTGIDGEFNDKEDTQSSFLDEKLKEKIHDVFSNMSYISVSGPISKRVLIDCGIDENSIHVIGNPALFYNIDRTNSNLDIENFQINKILINWSKYRNIETSERIEEQIEIVIQMLLNQGYDITIYPSCIEDIPSMESLGEKFTDQNLRIVKEAYSYYYFKEFMLNYDIAINMNLHFGIFSAAVNIPSITLAYSGACFDYIESIKYNGIMIPYDIFHAGELMKYLNDISHNYNQYVMSIQKVKSDYIVRMKEVYDQIYKSIEVN